MGLLSKAAKKVGKALKNAPKSFVTSPTDFLKSASQGDLAGAWDAAMRWHYFGLSPQSFINTEIDKVDGSGITTLADEQEQTKNRRQRLYSTTGGASGEEVLSVGAPAGRGTLFGN